MRPVPVVVLLMVVAACGGDSTGPGASAPVASLALALARATLLVRAWFEVPVRAVGRDGSVLTGRPITWSSSDSTVLSVSRGGVITALRAGTATVHAAAGDVTVSRELTVRALHFANVYTSRTVSCGREATGDLWCWGDIPATGFGNGSSKPGPSPVPRRAAIGHRFASLALSSYGFACGIELDGTVSCWGVNESGQLGDGTTAPHYSPVAVAGISGATAIAVGYDHACAITSDGSGYCWGENYAGEVGDGTRQPSRPSPVRVAGLTGATAISAGIQYSCAIAVGGPMCWGADASGELGHDTTYDRLVPTPASASQGYSAVTASEFHTCALSSGDAWCWGTFDTGAFDGWDIFAAVPTRQAAGHQFVRLADGARVQCGLEAGGAAWCWVYSRAPLQYPSAVPIVDVAVGFDIACALDANGLATCWDPRNAPGTPPRAVAGAPPFVRIAGGESTQSCGLTAGGAVWCWPNWVTETSATLASGTTTFSSIWSGDGGACAITPGGDAWCVRPGPSLYQFLPEPSGYALVEASPGRAHVCGRTAAGAVLCWGWDNNHGQLGDGTRTARAVPAPVAGGTAFSSIISGFDHTCGRTAAGTIYCWGAGIDGEFGDGGPFVPTPQPVSGNPAFTAIASGARHSCGLGTNGSLTCWPRRTTIPTAGPVSQITAGEDYVCGLDAAGAATCWGEGWRVVPLTTALRFATIVAGGATTCAITPNGATWCWGDNTGGILGSPDARGLTSSAVPVKVYGSE